MFQPATVSISGPAFSFLLYENCKGSVRQYGFLLGEIIHREITSITDQDTEQVNVTNTIKINSVIPFPYNNYFEYGQVDGQKIRKMLGDKFSKVVAWYKYEPTSAAQFTFKDKALHKQFKELFDVPKDLFSLCFLCMDPMDNLSIYSFHQSFLRYQNGLHDRLKFSITNLSESSDNYKNSEPPSAVFNKILSTTDLNLEQTKGLVAVNQIENAVQNYIDKTSQELATAEAMLFELEQEIAHLKEQDDQPEDVEDDVEEQDMISFEDKSVIDNASNCHLEASPELTRRSPRTKHKLTNADIENDFHSPDKRNLSPKSRGRGRGRKRST